ncbi:hypothetical protein CROQUDRAFT_41588 [Cronartium quercuum f. sp. fusiforme G11]|uniref:GPI ethanolamine phosphate transferase 2 n=1 Tax=Cronartium quercuum f. sp. fusiforme G11 TaxID=708437 RepID=A0A9P6TDF8_9BASI|nr:hypothetical protein CROQUDRAFT_41588 [Cronartium quercuum f. sp. fusiforme G11]
MPFRRTKLHDGYVPALVLIVQVLGAFFFAKGFFPINEPSEGYGLPLEDRNGIRTGQGFDRLVFMLIDALRTLVREGRALPFTAIAQSPTVTLPRLKAMTSVDLHLGLGINPQFIDAVWNIAESSDGGALLAHTDTWVRQIIYGPTVNSRHPQNATSKRRALFYGDDTWLRLFPKDWFEEHDGVSSFYVADTEIVDYNVTRHLDDALSDNPTVTWDVLILHYLGLDHVGHLGGAHSPLMGPKQTQLDHTISRIYKKLSDDDTASGRKSLLVVAGDHGMTDAGNHGGSSQGEVSAGLLFASPSFHLPGFNSSQTITPKRVQQLDIVPTLSVLFQGGIPPSSIGVMIESVIEAASSDLTTGHRMVEEQLRQNALQLARTLGSTISVEAVIDLMPTLKHDSLNTNLEQALFELDADEIREFLRQTQGRLLEKFSGHQLPTMVVGLSILALHEAWFFFGSTTLLVMAIWPNLPHSTTSVSSHQRVCYVMGSAFVRILRGWSRNGQKAKPDCSLSTILQSLPWTLNALDFVGLVFLLLRWRPNNFRGIQNTLFTTTLSLAGLLTMLPADHIAWILVGITPVAANQHNNVRVVYVLLFISLSVSVLGPTKRQRYLNIRLVYLVFLRSLTRPSNYVPLWVAFYAPELFSSSPFSWPDQGCFRLLRPQQQSVSASRDAATNKHEALVSAWVQLMFAKCTFFAFGGSNSLATVDLSNAYNGISSYSLPIVTALTYFSNFAGPICISLGFMTSTSLSENRLRSAKVIRFYLSAYHSLQLFMICIIGTSFSEHLFVYTVFSPAVLYGFVWTFFYHYSIMIIDYLFFWDDNESNSIK